MKFQNRLSKTITHLDSFGVPISLSFAEDKHIFRTLEGGICSLILGLFIFWQTYTHFTFMIFYENDYIQITESLTDFSELGVVEMNDMLAIPMYPIKYKGKNMPHNSQKICGGSCFDFVNRHFDIYWE